MILFLLLLCFFYLFFSQRLTNCLILLLVTLVKPYLLVWALILIISSDKLDFLIWLVFSSFFLGSSRERGRE